MGGAVDGLRNLGASTLSGITGILPGTGKKTSKRSWFTRKKNA
jgi:hypothetical protein